MLRWLGYLRPWPLTLTFDLEFRRWNRISGMGDLNVIERRGWESIECPDVKHYGNESKGCCADWGTFVLCIWPWIFKVKLYLGNGRPDSHGTKGMGVNRMPWCKRQSLCDLEAEETVMDRGDLRCRRFRRLIVILHWNLLLKWFHWFLLCALVGCLGLPMFLSLSLCSHFPGVRRRLL